jgi:hypothetical protein
MTIVVQHFRQTEPDPVIGVEAERILIHCIQDSDKGIDLIKELVQRALNCWPDAPKDLKDLGDMLTHGRITQDHTLTKINTQQNSDYYTPQEQVVIKQLIEEKGFDAWLNLLCTGEAAVEIAKRLK